jgi:hypothetical protein
MSIDDNVPTVPPPALPPAPARRRSRLLWLVPLAILLPATIMCATVLPMAFKHGPGDVPANVCALIPTDLLNRVVPAGKVEDPTSSNTEPYTNRARCTAQTDADSAPTTARATLSVELERHGSLAGQDPDEHAQDDFVSSKKFALARSISPADVFDVDRLGDSAFIAVRRRDDVDRREHRSTLDLWVLAHDRVLRLHYVASPTTDDRAASAVVAVARALLGALR